MRRVVVLLAVLCVCDGVRFGQLCSGNPSNRRRTSDTWGQGHYGARRCRSCLNLSGCEAAVNICLPCFRGNRDHKGLDIMCEDGSEVLAPFDVTLHGEVNVFTEPQQAAINSGLILRGEGLCFKLFAMRPDRTSGSVRKGDRIGTMLPMQSVYPGITSHVHVQMCDKSDPTQYF
ncbi:leukocyte cell-derived chemotaxin-2-like isoform X1 [Trachinotus anak]|uniref:leukocyte cell-derived chemotaxin-2-like isoform X1 n=1 Tax=Trachinotus anak TaxID=443729 RepID=UPI0039F1FFFE